MNWLDNKERVFCLSNATRAITDGSVSAGWEFWPDEQTSRGADADADADAGSLGFSMKIYSSPEEFDWNIMAIFLNPDIQKIWKLLIFFGIP